MSALVVILLVLLALLGLPLFAVIGGGALLGYLTSEQSLALFFASYYRQVSSTPIFIAIPLFTLAGYLMAESKSPERLVNLSRAAVGWMPGGLAIVALIACAGFTAFTGASGVTIVALGGLLMPAMLKDGYPKQFSLGLLTSSGSRGILFPPSLPLIVYAMVAGMTIQSATQIPDESGKKAMPTSEVDEAQAELDAALDDIMADIDDEGDEEEDGEDVLADLGIDSPEDQIAAIEAQAKAPEDGEKTEGAIESTGPPAAEPMMAVSVDRLFVAGLIPGIIAIVLVGIYAVFFGIRHKVPRTPFSIRELFKALRAMIWEVPVPIIIVGGIYGGLFTAIDAAAVTAAYVFIVEVLIYRDIPLRKVPAVLRESMVLVGGILLILMSAQALTNFFIDKEVPQRLFEIVQANISSQLTFLIVLNLFLLVVGTMMDVFSAILVVVPIITPVALHYGVNPVHLGIVFLSNLEIGFNTPPVGVNLFVGSLAFRRPVIELVRAVVPFLLISIVTLLLVTYWPTMSLFLIDVLGIQ